MGRNVNKQSQIAGQTFSTNAFFSVIFLHNYIWQFLIFTGVGFTAYIVNIVQMYDVNYSYLKDTDLASLGHFLSNSTLLNKIMS